MLSLFLFTVTILASEPTLHFEHLSLDSGLPQATVSSVSTDSKGFLWVGTAGGLARYDGYNFKTFEHSPDNPNSLSQDSIRSITEDSNGYIWVGTELGLNRFNPKLEVFKKYFFDIKNPNSLSNNYVTTITEDSQGYLWIGTRNGGLNRFSPKLEVFTHFKSDADNTNSLINNTILAIFEDSQGTLWIGTQNGLELYDSKSESFIHYQLDVSDSDNAVSSITEDYLGNLWFNTGKVLNSINLKTRTLSHYRHKDGHKNSLNDDKIRAIVVDKKNKIWVGFDSSGLNQFDPTTETILKYHYQASISSSLSDDSIYSIHKDDQDNLWIGTHDGGLNKLTPKTQIFNHYRSDIENPYSLSSDDIFAITEDNQGNLWLGSDSTGLNHFDHKTKKFSHYRHNADDINSLSDDSVNTITEDTLGNLWIGTASGGLNHFNKTTKTFTNYRHEKDNSNRLSNNSISSITEDTEGSLWLGTFGGGLNHFDPETKKFTHYRHKANINNSLSNDNINVVTKDYQGNLWIGTRIGLDYFDIKTNEFTHYPNNETPKNFHGNSVQAIKEDSQGGIWVGTLIGLNHLAPNTKEFTYYSKLNGLPNNAIYAIEEDDHGYIWLSTNQGLSRFNPKTESFKNYDVGDGLQNNEFNAGASFKSISGELFFGGINGFNRFVPEQVKDDKKSPVVIITDMFLSNKSVPIVQVGSEQIKDFTLPQAIHLTDAITLNYYDNIVAFEFSALHFINPKKNQYAYKLEGFDENWIITDYKNRRATYTNIPDGNYLLRIKASNADGYWNEEGTSLKITMLPPLWKTWWAYTFYGLMLLSLLWFFVRVQRNKVLFEREINKQLENKVIERTLNLQKANEKLEELSLTDQLTGLKNRRFLLNNLQIDIDLVLRNYRNFKLNNTKEINSGSDLIFFLIDLDHFKQVNDIHGHTAGDAVLIQIKGILEQVFRETDYLVRWGGEEFLVIARFTQRNNAPELAERLRQSVENHDFDIGEDKVLKKTCSIGFACYPFSTQDTEALTWSEIIDVADHCMYAAKKSSRNAWVGLNNKVNSRGDDLFTSIIGQTQKLIQSNELEMLTSISESNQVNW